MRQDVIIVGCAGDDALQPQKPTVPNKYPASWASDNFPLIVAGAVTLRGDYAKFSQGNNRSISHNIAWAPGDPVICASAEGYMYQQGRGTGIAAGMVRKLQQALTGKRHDCLSRYWLSFRLQVSRPTSSVIGHDVKAFSLRICVATYMTGQVDRYFHDTSRE